MSPEQIKLIVAAVIVAVAAFGGWEARGWKEGEKYQAMVADINQQKVDALEKAAKETETWKNRVSEIDAKRSKESRDAQHKIDDLTHSLRAGTVSLSVAARCQGGVPGSPGDPGVGDGTTRVELHPETSGDLTALTGECDQVTRQLNAAQDILDVLQRKKAANDQ